jgi:hypothetical protein
MIHIERFTLRDAQFISNHLRPEDWAEIGVISDDPRREVMAGALGAALCYTVRRSKYALHPDILYGVTTDQTMLGAGIVWLVGTPLVHRVALSFLKAAPGILEDLVVGYDFLHNYVDERNTLHLRWLKHLGFTFNSRVVIKGYNFTHAVWRPGT